MIFDFIRPYLLILLPIAIAAVILMGRKKGKKLYTAVRCVLVTMIILALSGLQIDMTSDRTDTLFMVDTSKSMENNIHLAEEFIDSALEHKGKKDITAVMSFGKNASVESSFDSEMKNVSFDSWVDGNFTDISEGMKVGSSLFKNNDKKRMVIISDGEENIGESIKMAEIIKEQGIIADTYMINNGIQKEVQISALNVPKYINKNSNYEIEAVIESLEKTDCRLKIYKNDEVIFEKDVTAEKGINRFVVSDKANDDAKGIKYKATVEPKEDTYKENNKIFAYAYIDDVPNILLVEKNGSGEEIHRLLENANVRIKRCECYDTPNDAAQLSGYDEVIIADCAYEDMDKEFTEMLDGYVKNTGGGLLVTGGENAFAPGGYKDTVLEDILPVKMELKDEEELPNMAMIMVIDHSGSMSGNKMDLAKESIIRSIDTVNEKDIVGVLAFDDENYWVVEPQKVDKNKEDMKNSVAQIQSSGGTSILPALQTAYDNIINQDTKLKHIILLTDGQDSSPGYDALITKMNLSGVTLSTVAVGSDSDKALLKELAVKGNGRYYFSDEFTDLPKIFAKETAIAGRNYINDEEFYPKSAGASAVLSGAEGMPPLGGYISTTAKDRADVILKADNDEPVAASWQYGLGKSTVWTSDVEKWCGDWFAQESGTRIFRNLISSMIKKQTGNNYNINIESTKEGTKIIFETDNYEGIDSIKCRLFGDEFEEELNFTPVSPSKYEAVSKAEEQGIYMFNAEIKYGDEVNIVSSGINIPYSKEYDINYLKGNPTLLKNISYRTGGKVLNSPEEVFYEIKNEVIKKYELTNLLLWLAVLLFLGDIAMRRFNIKIKTPKKFNKEFEKSENMEYNEKSTVGKENDSEKTGDVQKRDESTAQKNNVSEEVKRSSTSSILISNKKKRKS